MWRIQNLEGLSTFILELKQGKVRKHVQIGGLGSLIISHFIKGIDNS